MPHDPASRAATEHASLVALDCTRRLRDVARRPTSPPLDGRPSGTWMNRPERSMRFARAIGNDGTLSDDDDSVPRSAEVGRAYSFNGSSSKVSVPNDSSLNPGSQNVTIQARVRFPDRPSAAIGDFDMVRKQRPAGSGTYNDGDRSRRAKRSADSERNHGRDQHHRWNRPVRQRMAHDHGPEDVVEHHAHRGRRLLHEATFRLARSRAAASVLIRRREAERRRLVQAASWTRCRSSAADRNQSRQSSQRTTILALDTG